MAPPYATEDPKGWVFCLPPARLLVDRQCRGAHDRGAPCVIRKEGCHSVDAPAQYLQWGFILISIPNLLMIVGMILVFIVALLAPSPRHDDARESWERRHE